MLKRALIGTVLVLCGGLAAADDEDNPVLRLGDSHWELFRPQACKTALYDLDYMTNSLRAARPGFGLRFRGTAMLEINLRFDPINDRRDFVGPVYDSHIGATVLTFAVNF